MGAIYRNGKMYGSNMAINDSQTGSDTTWSSEKTSDEIDSRIAESNCLVITITAFSSLPQTVTNSKITSDMVVVNSVLGTPSAQTGDWTWTTSDGSLTVTGSISGSTTLTLYLVKQQ